jgi:hypothetical protein
MCGEMRENMSEALVTQNTALQTGGVGIGSSIFKAKPGMVELVHKSSRQENVRYGEFRIIGNNEHLGTKIRVVLLAVPQTQREWFIDPKVYSKENKGCFSLDGIMPHPNASQPPALECNTCPKGDVNWVKWRKTKDPKDLPPCGAYWHLLVALRDTQMPYFINLKGKSYKPFLDAMQQQMQPLLAKLLANARAENKPRGYTWVKDRFELTPGFVLPEGQTQQPALPAPNIFDISFSISSTSKDGGSFFMKFDEFMLMKPEDRAEFGNLYLELKADREQRAGEYEKAEAEAALTEAQADAEFNAPDKKPVGEVLPPITI